MKKQTIILSILLVFISAISFGQKYPIVNKDTIKVWGNCESCKKRIESAAVNAGVVNAVWNEESKLLLVTYDGAKTSNRKIQEKVAAAGYDTQDVEAPGNAYNKLPGCCKYDRKPAETKQ